MMKAYVIGLGEVYISRMFLQGHYKYGYVGDRLVKYDYGTGEWALACKVS